MENQFKVAVVTVFLFTLAVLKLERESVPVQVQLGVATALLLCLVSLRLRIPIAQVLCCVAVATMGELILSVALGLYRYQHALIPLYVPPGHGIFYALAVATARQPFLRRHARGIEVTVLAIGSVLATISLFWRHDSWGFLWWIAAAGLLAMLRQKLLLSACIVYTMVLELAGTYNGNWQWVPTIPFLNLSAANPPAGVGILYVLLDLIVVAVMSVAIGARQVDDLVSPDYS